MADVFHSCEITPNGISVKVMRDGVGHRVAIGVGDYATKADFITAVAALLAGVLGRNLALVAANVAAAETDQSAKLDALCAAHAADLAALQASHEAHCAALEADIAALGTKDEAIAIRKKLEREQKLAQLAALTAELRVEEHAEMEATDAKP